jgi:hypothetical protein
VLDLSKDEWAVLPPRQQPYEARSAVAWLKVKRRVTRVRTPDGGETVTEAVEEVGVRLFDKVRALDMLMRHLGLYEPPPPLEVLLSLLPPDLARLVRRELAKSVGASAGQVTDPRASVGGGGAPHGG